MEDLIRQLITAARGMWRRRWVGVAVAWVVTIAGGVVLFKIPDRYEASARVFVDTQSILKPLMAGMAIQPDLDQQIGMLSRTLISRPNIEKLIVMAELDRDLATPAAREELIATLTRTLKVQSIGRENLYTISYRDSDRDEARRVVQALMSIFVESSMGDKRRDTDSARRFIDEQIKTYEKKLEEAENRVKEFKLKHLGTMGGDGRDYFARMSTLSEELAKARLELRAAEESRDALKREMSGEDPVFLPDPRFAQMPSTGTPVSEIDVRIDTLKKSLDELMRRYTELHPDVANTRRLIAELEREKKQDLEARKKALDEAKVQAKAPTISAAANPVYQQLKVALAESEASVASLRARAGDLEARYRQLQAAAKMLPELEAQFAQLNRDYGIQKRNYEALVSRRESAAMTTELDATAIADFRIIDPPKASTTPVAPNRMVLLPLVLLVALGAGAFASFALSQVLPTFHDARMLKELTQRPVLGTVELHPGPDLLARRRAGRFMFAGSVAGLFVLIGVAMILVSVTGLTA